MTKVPTSGGKARFKALEKIGRRWKPRDPWKPDTPPDREAQHKRAQKTVDKIRKHDSAHADEAQKEIDRIKEGFDPKSPRDVAMVILEGDVVAFKPKSKAETFGPDDKVTFKQIQHGRLGSSDYLKHIEKHHPAAHTAFKKIHDEGQNSIKRSYAHEVHKNGKHAAYMVMHRHEHKGQEYETTHVHDLNGHKISHSRHSISDRDE